MDEEQRTKECDFCRMTIPEGAMICPYCQEVAVVGRADIIERLLEKQPEMHPELEIKENPNLILGVLSFFIPVVGLVMGLVYITRSKIKDKATARICFSAGLAGFIIWGVVIICISTLSS